jgi:hypothetical protein
MNQPLLISSQQPPSISFLLPKNYLAETPNDAPEADRAKLQALTGVKTERRCSPPFVSKLSLI